MPSLWMLTKRLKQKCQINDPSWLLLQIPTIPEVLILSTWYQQAAANTDSGTRQHNIYCTDNLSFRISCGGSPSCSSTVATLASPCQCRTLLRPILFTINRTSSIWFIHHPIASKVMETHIVSSFKWYLLVTCLARDLPRPVSSSLGLN